MISIIIPAILILTAICIKLCVDVIGLVLFLRKDKELISKPNHLEKKYQFIKGLY
jgi:multisubunit Na+/H+ antiporter MnhC subunit